MPKILSGEAWTPPNTTPAGTGANTTETDLQSVVIPAGALTTGDEVRIRAAGQSSGSGGTKTLRFYFGATLFNLLTILGSGSNDWVIDVLVIVTGASAQKGSLMCLNASGILSAVYATPAEAIANAITVKTTGQTSNAADEITSEMLVVEILPA